MISVPFLLHYIHFFSISEDLTVIKPMARNIKRYYQAWELRRKNLTFKQIGKIMGITGSRAAVLSNHIDFKIKYQKQWRISNELKALIKKYYLTLIRFTFAKSVGS